MRVALLALLLPLTAFAENYAECILDKMPGAANAAMHRAVLKTCSTESSPSSFLQLSMGSGRGIFGFRNENACVLKKAKETTFGPAAIAINSACYCLYKEPDFDGEMCDYPRDGWGNKIIPYPFDPKTARPAK